jgi:non-canonical (house-cleaning) NTP pyrophosphatase
MKITICGSIVHSEAMEQAAKVLEMEGYEMETPHSREGEIDYDSLTDTERAKIKDSLIREHLDKINESDAIFVFNEDKKGIEGYVGGSTLMEMAFAYAQGIEIFLLKNPTGVSYTEEILGTRPILLHNDIRSIIEYFATLPKTYVSSKSPIKLRSVSRGMRRAGIRTNILAHPMESNVNEQPQSIEETYAGAGHRHQKLKQALALEQFAYLATIESGNHVIHPSHNDFASTVVILEPINGVEKAGISIEVEFPKDMTDKVPSKYPDLGTLVQAEYGSTLKDPFPYFTNGKVTRLQLMENAVFNIAVQLPREGK